ncbi:MAG: hypothetical protein ACQUHE_09830 [Bacteroidia bacterium]
MKTTFYLLVLSCVFLSTTNVNAQSTLRNRNFSELLMRSPAYEVYLDLRGEPFLFSDWAKAKVTTDYATTEDVKMLYNEVSDELTFKVAKRDVRKVSAPVKEFAITDEKNGNVVRKFRAGFKDTKFSNAETFFEVLVDGDTKLLKKNLKYIYQNREYSGKVARTVVDDPTYYLVFNDNVPIKLKSNQKLFVSQFGEKLKDLDKYIQENELDVKKQADLIKLVSQYN